MEDPAGHAYPALHAPVQELDVEPPVPNLTRGREKRRGGGTTL